MLNLVKEVAQRHTSQNLPLMVALLVLFIGGVFLLDRADAQARDTIRKHHLEDIEQALYFAERQHGTLPPYDKATWCGRLNDPANTEVRSQIEAALRQQHEKYENPDKPFPSDPLGSDQGYFYWKHSPTTFELFAVLEADPTGDRTTEKCSSSPKLEYDYGLNSHTRQFEIWPTL